MQLSHKDLKRSILFGALLYTGIVLYSYRSDRDVITSATTDAHPSPPTPSYNDTAVKETAYRLTLK